MQREVFGRELLRHDEAGQAVAGGEQMQPLLWADGAGVYPVELQDAKDGDILHMRGLHNRRISDLHIGIFTGPMQVLHTEAGTGAVIERIDSKRAAWRAIQAYRFEK